MTNLADAVKTILLTDSVSSQEEIRWALEKQGHLVNQSKISRLLRKIGAVKITNGNNQIVYSIPQEPAPTHSKQVLSQLIVKITANESLIIIHTNPGCASLIARLLDHHAQNLNILGTVAGDDTLFIAPTSTKKTDKTLMVIKDFLVI